MRTTLFRDAEERSPSVPPDMEETSVHLHPLLALQPPHASAITPCLVATSAHISPLSQYDQEGQQDNLSQRQKY